MDGPPSANAFRLPLVLAFIAGVFVLDWLTPLGWAVWLLDFVPITFAYWSSRRFEAIYLAAICAVLVVVGFFVSVAGIAPELAIFNRSLGIFSFGILGFLISTVKQAQEDLRHERDLSDSIINSLPGVFYLYDEQRHFLRWNRNFETITGYSAEEMTQRHPLDFFAGDDKQLLAKKIEQVFRTGAGEVEADFVSKTGKRTPFFFNGVRTEMDGRSCLMGMGLDISQRKRVESERDRLFNLSIDMLCVASFNGFFKQLNPAWQKMLGWTVTDLLDKPWLDHVHPDDRDATVKALEELTHGKPVLGFENRYCRRDGSYCWISWNAFALPDEQLIFAVARDVTEGKRMEAELRESETRLRRIFEQAGDAILVISADNRFLDTNARGLEMTGYTREEFLRLSVADILAPHERPRLDVEPARMMSGQPHLAEWEHLRKDGSTFPAEVSARRLNDGSYLALVRDMTERKRAEAIIRESQARLQLLVHASNIGLWDWNLVTNEVYFSSEWKSQLGYTDDELPNRYEEWESRLHPDDRAETKMAVKDYLENRRGDYAIEFRLRHKDGSWRWISTNADLVRAADGRPMRLMGCHVDITDRKQAEQIVLDSHARLQSILNSMFPFVGLLSLDGIVLEVNRPPMEAAGLRREDVVGKMCADTYWYSYSPVVQAQLREALARAARGEAVRYDVPIRIANEQFITIDLMFGPLRDSQGNIVQIVGSAVDITARKQAEADLRRFRLIADSSRDFIGMCDLQFQPLYVNPAGLRLVGLDSLEAACRVKVPDYFFPEDRAFITDEFFPRVLRDGHGEIEIRLQHFQTGATIWMLYYLFHVRDATGAVIGWATVSRNIDDRRRAEQALRESEERLRLALDAAQMGAWSWDIASHQTSYSAELGPLFGLPAGAGATRRDTFLNCIHPEDRPSIDSAIQQVLDYDAPYLLDYRVIWPDGSIHWVASRGQVERDSAGKPRKVAGIAMDITARKQAEEKVNAQLAELMRWHKVTLGRETRVQELKDEVNQLLAAQGLPSRYVGPTLSAQSGAAALNVEGRP